MANVKKSCFTTFKKENTMQESTRKRKQSKIELLEHLKSTSSDDAYDLAKLRFKVVIYENKPESKWAELSYSEIYDSRFFWIYHRNGTLLVKCGTYFTLNQFCKFTKKFRKIHGLKNIENMLDDLMIGFVESYPCQEVFCM